VRLTYSSVLRGEALILALVVSHVAKSRMDTGS
jgi:hypothetical protein